MRYLLDTDICIYYINGFEPKVRENLHQHRASDIVVSAITNCEMYAGSSGSRYPARSRAEQDFFLRQLSACLLMTEQRTDMVKYLRH